MLTTICVRNFGAKAGLMILFFAWYGSSLYATTYYSRVTTGNFNTAGTWSVNPSGTPTNTTALSNADVFIIQNGHTITANGSRTVSGLTINAGGTFNIAARTFTFLGDCLNDGTITGTSGQLTINANDFTNNGSYTVATGRINLTTGSVTNNGSITYTSNGRMILADGSLTNNGSISFAASCQLTKTTGVITNNATGTITVTSGTATITMGTGDFINLNTSASVDFASSNVIITGTAASQNIGGFVTAGRLSCTKTAGTVTLNGDITATGITMNGSGGTMDMGAGLTHTTNGTVILTAGTLYGNSSTINVAIVSTSAWGGSNAAVFDPGTSTVNLNAAGDQRLSASGTKTFYNLTFSNTGLKTDATTTVNNILSIEGDATASAAPTYGPNATLQYNTANARTAGVEWITPFDATGGVIIANTGAITANEDKVFNDGSPLTINTGATLTADINNFTFNGNFINNGTWTPSSGDITITGTATQGIGTLTTSGTVFMTKTAGVATFNGNINGNNLTMNGSGGTLNLGTGKTHTFSGTWTNSAGTLQGNTSTLNIDGTVSGTAITFTANTGTVNYRGSSPQSIPVFTYYDMGCSGAGTKSLTGTTTVGHVLTISASSELDLGSNTLNLTGNGTPLVNNGTFTASTSTVNYTNASATNITAVDYYNLNGTGGNRTFLTTASIGIAGTFTVGAGTYTVTNSTVDFNGTGAQNIPAFTFYHLIISNAGIKSVLASITVACQTLAINDAASVEINADGGGKLNVLQ